MVEGGHVHAKRHVRSQPRIAVADDQNSRKDLDDEVHPNEQQERLVEREGRFDTGARRPISAV